MHRNAPLMPEGRLRLCHRIEGGWPVAHAAESMGISRDRAYVWWRRYQEEGVAGLEDRPCRPRRCPRPDQGQRRASDRDAAACRGLGPARIAGIVGMHPSTVHRVLTPDHVERAASASASGRSGASIAKA
jgi:leucine-zipper of insertion element IS481